MRHDWALEASFPQCLSDIESDIALPIQSASIVRFLG